MKITHILGILALLIFGAMEANAQVSHPPIRQGTADPATCSPTAGSPYQKWFYRTDLAAWRYCSGLNTWTTVGAAGGGCVVSGLNNQVLTDNGAGGCVSEANLTFDGTVATSPVYNATTGYRFGGAATSGQVLRGNGTNFIAAQLALSDLSGFSSGSANAIVKYTGANTIASSSLSDNGSQASYSGTGGFILAGGPFINSLGTITGDTPALSMSATFNNGAATFKHIFGNITNTASAAGSRWMELQVGGSPIFSIDLSGNVRAGSSGAGAFQPATGSCPAGVASTSTFCSDTGDIPSVRSGTGAVQVLLTSTTTKIVDIPLTGCVVDVATLPGNAFMDTMNLSTLAMDIGVIKMKDAVDSAFVCQVLVPNELDSTPAAKVIFDVAPNVACGASQTFDLNISYRFNDAAENMNTAPTTETAQAISGATTAHVTTRATFPSAGSLASAPAAGEIGFIRVIRDGDDATNDTCQQILEIPLASLKLRVTVKVDI